LLHPVIASAMLNQLQENSQLGFEPVKLLLRLLRCLVGLLQ